MTEEVTQDLFEPEIVKINGWRNAKYSAPDGSRIDCEIDNSKWGWIPTTLREDDVEEITRTLWAEVASSGEIAPYEAPPPTPYSISKMTPWDRMTEAEAELMENFMDSASAKMRQTYNAAQYLESSHPLFAYLEQVMAATLPGGEARAKELLAPEGN